jgi:hypothetical protein
LQKISPCTINCRFFQRHLEAFFLPSDSVIAPKETKKDRERRLKKAEELTETDAPTDGPTDNDEPDEELLYDAEGGLMRPRPEPPQPQTQLSTRSPAPRWAPIPYLQAQ